MPVVLLQDKGMNYTSGYPCILQIILEQDECHMNEVQQKLESELCHAQPCQCLWRVHWTI